MKDVLVVVSSNNGVEPETRMCIDKLREEGASYIEQQGTSDVAMARNIALTLACAELKKAPSLNTVLMIDDDMHFTLEDAKAVTSAAKDCAVSGVAITSKRMFAHHPISKTRWAGGLFFLAIPRAILLDLSERSKVVEIRGAEGNWPCTVFTWTGAEDRRWVGEDIRLSSRLGGVQLAPIPIGHLKKQALYFGEPGQIEEIRAFIMNALEKYNG